MMQAYFMPYNIYIVITGKSGIQYAKLLTNQATDSGTAEALVEYVGSSWHRDPAIYPVIIAIQAWLPESSTVVAIKELQIKSS